MNSPKDNRAGFVYDPIYEDQHIAKTSVGVNICVVGGGFVGLVTAAGFAQFGHRVVCIENDPIKLNMLRAGKVPFFENGLEELIRVNMRYGRLSFAMELEEAVEGQQAIFVTVGTPPLSSGRTDMGALNEVIETLSPIVRGGQIIVLKSTVPMGTARRIYEILTRNGYGERAVAVINNPEFLREGMAVHDFFHPKRIVIGGESSHAIEFVKKIYTSGMAHPAPILVTDNATAEIIKYASNAFLATKIGFANELANLCDSVGVNIFEVTNAMGLDTRIGPDFLNPGPGWGGSCLPKDLSEFIGLGETRGISLLIAKSVQEANRRQFEMVAGKVRKLTGDLKGKRIGVLGLSFKAGTNDMRGAPAIPIIKMMLAEEAMVIAFDPAVSTEATSLIPGIELAEIAPDVASDADCILILTEWPEFHLLDWRSMASRMRNRNLVDSRNLLSPEVAGDYGFRYLSMGQDKK
jgi:UDPglucose 6-dehydrogenase